MVMDPGVVVTMVMLVPATRLVGPKDALFQDRIWPLTVPAVEVLVPPLAMGKMPETSVPKATLAV